MAKKVKNILDTPKKFTFSFFAKIKSKLTRKRLIFIVIIIAVIGGIWFFVQKRSAKDIETAAIKKGKVSRELILTGEVAATEHAKLYFPTSGKIAWVGVSIGDEVKKGQALISLDKTTLTAAYQTALNNVRMYEANVDYVHDTLKNKDTTENFEEKDTRTTAEVTKDNAYDDLKAAEYNLANSTLSAPFAGKVTFVAHLYPGVNVFYTESQIELININTIYFDVSADQNEVVDLAEGQQVTIMLDSFPEEEFSGKVGFISTTPKENEAGAVYQIKINFIPESVNFAKLRVGMTGDASFTLQKKESVLYVPYKFVNSDKDGKYVNLGKKNKKVHVEVGLEGEEVVEISGDIHEGDTVYD